MVKYTIKALLHTKTLSFFGQAPESSSKVLYKLKFFMEASIVVLDTDQM